MLPHTPTLLPHTPGGASAAHDTLHGPGGAAPRDAGGAAATLGLSLTAQPHIVSFFLLLSLAFVFHIFPSRVCLLYVTKALADTLQN